MSEHEHHIAPTKLYVFIFLSLIVLTGVTVMLSIDTFDIGTTGNIILGLIVATVKASLVVLFFMHLKEDAKSDISIRYFAIFPIILFFIAVAGNLPDIAFRLGDAKPAPEENRINRPSYPEGHNPLEH